MDQACDYGGMLFNVVILYTYTLALLQYSLLYVLGDVCNL